MSKNGIDDLTIKLYDNENSKEEYYPLIFRFREVEKVKTIREHKGKSKLSILDDYIVIDLETTGLDPGYDDIIEIGALKVSNGNIIEKFNTLINPLYEISEFTTKLTGITNEMLKDAPDLKSALPSLLSFIGPSIVLAHNANFDVNFLYDKCMDNLCIPFTNDFVDTMRISRRLFKEIKSHRLKKLIKQFGLEGKVQHRALGDCLCVYNLYEFMKKHIIENSIDISSKLKRKRNHKHFRASDIISSNTEFDENNLFYKKVCVFTGKLEKFTRKKAMQFVVDLGGIVADSVTKQTNYLILGNNEYCKTIKSGKSNKQKKAEEYILKGQDLKIISEKLFYDML